MGDIGLEESAVFSEETPVASRHCAHDCATGEIPPVIAEVGSIEAWSALPPSVRQAIATMNPEVLKALRILMVGPLQSSREGGK
jgi:hypothetical protein